MSDNKMLCHAKSFRVMLSVFLAAQQCVTMVRPIEANDGKIRLPLPLVKHLLFFGGKKYILGYFPSLEPTRPAG
jgi:hypothetical protein